MLTSQENDLLCRVEGDAAMGRLMRRHWIPVCLAEEVAEADGTPVHAKILGEDLVVFRDTDGNVGVLDEHCPHRRASLVMGRNEEGGLRCLCHGWKVDVKGNRARDGEPASGARCRKVKHIAYPRDAARAHRRRQGDPDRVAPPLDRQGAAPAAAANPFRLPLCRDSRADREFIDPRLHSHHPLPGAVPGHIPPNNMYNLSILHIPQDGYNTYTSTSSHGATRGRASTRSHGASSAARRSASTSTGSTASSPTATTTTCRTGRARSSGTSPAFAASPCRTWRCGKPWAGSPIAAPSDSARATSRSWSCAASWWRP